MAPPIERVLQLGFHFKPKQWGDVVAVGREEE
jgi:hypothetical protein